MPPLTIKDFKAGQTAYVAGRRYNNSAGLAMAAEVTKVGRRYVTVRVGAYEVRFKEGHSTDCPYLVEHTDYGAGSLLFPSSEAVDEYCELESLHSWLRRESDLQKSKKYTLTQLRAVKEILEDGAGVTGQLVILPCKVTDTVYIPESIFKGKKIIGERVVSAQIDHVTIGGTTGKPVFDICSETGNWYYSLEPGEFYLTREEAEAAIAKRGDQP